MRNSDDVKWTEPQHFLVQKSPMNPETYCTPDKQKPTKLPQVVLVQKKIVGQCLRNPNLLHMPELVCISVKHSFPKEAAVDIYIHADKQLDESSSSSSMKTSEEKQFSCVSAQLLLAARFPLCLWSPRTVMWMRYKAPPPQTPSPPHPPSHLLGKKENVLHSSFPLY